MYLKALEIQGFKSFPDKTILNFAEDITAIVGPNGSGKSNISDAIRWVMGEQSTRTLRGSKMEDVIFGGTEKRAQVGFAQVTLVIDNTSRIFPMEESEVAVTRRYYRSGESEYYINRQAVRLRDVNELFMDTGLGHEGYSIIGQGKIDELLSVKSAERRGVFEEAAGISKFRYRKEDSERKLQRTEENLLRINDKIAELELQVEPLRDQAEKARRYLILRDELRGWEVSVWVHQLSELHAAVIRLEGEYEAARRSLGAANEELEALYRYSEQFSGKLAAVEEAAEAIRAKRSLLDGQISECESKIAVMHSEVGHHEADIARMRSELSEQSSRTGNLRRQMEGQRARIAEIDAQTEQLHGELGTLLEQARALSGQADSIAGRAEALRGKEALCMAQAADKRAELSALRSGVGSGEERRAAAREERAEARARREETTRQAEESRRALTQAQEERESAANVISGHTLRMESRRQKAKAAADRVMQLTMDKNAMESRIRLLSEMEKEYEGFSKAVRTVMQAALRGALRGVRGPVASLLHVDEAYTVAIETALGAGMQNLVVDREEDAKAAISFLKQRDSGRATFLPLSAMCGEALRERVRGEAGFVGIASALVRYDRQYDGVFQNLLGRTVVVEDLDSGIAMARKFGARFRIVTLDGQIMNRGGSMTGGSISRSAGILSRANELERLQGQLGLLGERLQAARHEQEESEREQKAAQYELEVAEGQKRQAEDAVLKLETEQQHYRVLLESLAGACENLDGELEALEGRLSVQRAAAEQAERDVAALEADAAHWRAEAECCAGGQAQAREQAGALGEQVNAAKERAARLAAERETTQRALADLEQVCRDLLSDRSERETLVNRYEAEIAALQKQIEEETGAIAALRTEGDARQAELEALSQKKLELEAERTAKDRESREKNDVVLHLEREVGRLEQKKATSAMEEKQILDRLWDNYELSYEDARTQSVELESLSKTNRRIGELRREISALGTPNIGAIEEFDRVNTRYEYLSEQRGDVEKAKEELLGVIGGITAEMQRIFREQFTLINESFQQTFLELFGGGQARLELEDEEDILNCGIEIKVQPPGKTLKTISLLSGGEKAFVAIALYFAILQVHPTPFCVMDEIEAALDESNVVRYAHYMRRIAGKTQFIVITHRRGTMEEADVLYGVTMQERGISKVLTINLNDMAKELKLE